MADCPKCGHDHRTPTGHEACGGHQKQARGGGPCRSRAGAGTDHPGYGNCKFHGGTSRNGQRHAQRAHAEEAVRVYGLPVVTTPEQALLDEVHRTAGHVAWLRERIADLDPDALTWGLTKREKVGASEFTGTNSVEAAAVHVWLELYLRERRHLVDVCAKAITAGIAERQVRLAEAQGQLMAQALIAILDGLALTEEQREKVPELVDRHLHVV